jgi:hypothetical protein
MNSVVNFEIRGENLAKARFLRTSQSGPPEPLPRRCAQSGLEKYGKLDLVICATLGIELAMRDRA